MTCDLRYGYMAKQDSCGQPQLVRIEAYLHALKTDMKAIIKHLYFCNTVTNNLGRSLLIKKKKFR